MIVMMSQKQNSSVCIVGVGACTAIGLTAPSSAAAVRAGIAGFVEHPYMIDRNGEPMIVARAPYLSNEIVCQERFLELALPAAQEALTPVSEFIERVQPISVIIGLPVGRPGLPNAFDTRITEKIKEAFKRSCKLFDIESIASGHSAGLMALEVAWRKIQNGTAEFCLVGGVDSYLEPETLEWLEECEQLHGGPNAWGFIPGEAAGFCLMASQRAAEKYKLSILCKVLAVATAWESNLIKTETVCIGQGLSGTFKQVLEALPSPNDKIDQIICDINGEPYRADEYGFTIARFSERFVDPTEFLAPADCWGDVGAASGPLFIGLVVAANLRGYSKGSHTVVWTSSESGERSAALIQINSLLDNYERNH